MNLSRCGRSICCMISAHSAQPKSRGYSFVVLSAHFIRGSVRFANEGALCVRGGSSVWVPFYMKFSASVYDNFTLSYSRK